MELNFLCDAVDSCDENYHLHNQHHNYINLNINYINYLNKENLINGSNGFCLNLINTSYTSISKPIEFTRATSCQKLQLLSSLPLFVGVIADHLRPHSLLSSLFSISSTIKTINDKALYNNYYQCKYYYILSSKC
jgi:hypothetical protein